MQTLTMSDSREVPYKSGELTTSTEVPCSGLSQCERSSVRTVQYKSFQTHLELRFDFSMGGHALRKLYQFTTSL